MNTRYGQARFRIHHGPGAAEESHQARTERELHEALYATIEATHYALTSLHRWSAATRCAETRRGQVVNSANAKAHRTALALQDDLVRMLQQSHRLYVAVRASTSDETARRLAERVNGLIERFAVDQRRPSD